MKLAESMDELRRRVAQFMQVEDMRDFRKQIRTKSSSVEMKVVDEKLSSGKERLKGPRFSNYTSLSVLQAKILEEALNVDLLLTPRKKSTPLMSMVINIFCTIETSVTLLRDKIEELVRTNHLKYFVRKDQEEKSLPRRRSLARSPRSEDKTEWRR